MNSMDLYRAMAEVEDDILERSENMGRRHKRMNSRRIWAVAAACLCIMVAGAAFLHTNPSPARTEGTGITISENGVTIPPINVTLSSNGGEAFDMIPFFIYQERCYVGYENFQEPVNFVGRYRGTAIGLIDEWTPKDGYVEFAGSVRGDFYEVKGYDPSFMLCLKNVDATFTTYICNNGITLKYGSELYEDRLHLSDNFKSIQYESRASWYYSKNELYQMNGGNDIVVDFIDALNSARFVPWESVSLGQGNTDNISDIELYHLYFGMKDGTTVHLRLRKDGYVLFQGILDICVQLPGERYDALLKLLDSHTNSTPVR